MEWDVAVVGKSKKLPNDIQESLISLVLELRVKGPVLPKRPHFGKIKGKKATYHCHLAGGHPTYVACWRRSAENKIEVYYVGTHENAPY
jgi:hypothetical protein